MLQPPMPRMRCCGSPSSCNWWLWSHHIFTILLLKWITSFIRITRRYCNSIPSCPNNSFWNILILGPNLIINLCFVLINALKIVTFSFTYVLLGCHAAVLVNAPDVVDVHAHLHCLASWNRHRGKGCGLVHHHCLVFWRFVLNCWLGSVFITWFATICEIKCWFQRLIQPMLCNFHVFNSLLVGRA